jgi:hypothetical protein
MIQPDFLFGLENSTNVRPSRTFADSRPPSGVTAILETLPSKKC